MFNQEKLHPLFGIKIPSTLTLVSNWQKLWSQIKSKTIRSQSKISRLTLFIRTLATVTGWMWYTITRCTISGRAPSLRNLASTTAQFSQSWGHTRKLVGPTRSNTCCSTTFRLKACRLRSKRRSRREAARSSILTTVSSLTPFVSTPPPSFLKWSCTSTTRAVPWKCSLIKANIHTKLHSILKNLKSLTTTLRKALRRAITHANFLVKILKTSIRNSTPSSTVAKFKLNKK